MKELYLIMERCLKSEYDLKALLCVLETLEGGYSEEQQIQAKSVISVVKGYLLTLLEDVHTTTGLIDDFIVAAAANRE